MQPLGELSDFVTFCIKNILLWGLCYVKNEGIFPEKQEEQMKDFKVIPGSFSSLPKV